MPPFDGPRAMLCVTRYPVNDRTSPSSSDVGIDTSTAFLHSCRTLTRRWSIPNVSATLSSCCCASANGFSRRCVSRRAAIGANLLDREPDLRPARLRVPRQGRPRRKTQLVALRPGAGRLVGPRPVIPKLYEPGSRFAEPGEHPDEPAGRACRAARRAARPHRSGRPGRASAHRPARSGAPATYPTARTRCCPARRGQGGSGSRARTGAPTAHAAADCRRPRHGSSR